MSQSSLILASRTATDYPCPSAPVTLLEEMGGLPFRRMISIFTVIM